MLNRIIMKVESDDTKYRKTASLCAGRSEFSVIVLNGINPISLIIFRSY